MMHNPVLRGFHPDPSIIYHKGTYYLAVSTFEWFPGVRIYRSENLSDWEYVTAPLDSFRLLDMRGIEASSGIWAPDLSYKDGYFYLVYTVVRNTHHAPAFDCPNYVTRAKVLEGPWSDPVYLNSSGFDPSLFHDDDGRSWLVNMEWDYRKVKEVRMFTGILLQEYDTEKGCLTGEVHRIYTGTKRRFTEGPHLYKKEGRYYLLCAEGGTTWFHAETAARSDVITGPYETDPMGSFLTSWDGTPDSDLFEKELQEKGLRDSYLQKCGHASICKNNQGEWIMAHLCGRPVPGTMSCVLGRETAIQRLIWSEDGWPRLECGSPYPKDRKDTAVQKEAKEIDKRYDFSNADFLRDFQTLRVPWDDNYYSLSERPGYLRLTGRESVYSKYYQTLLARRQDAFSFTAETEMEFSPESFQHMAGLIYRYNEKNFYYLYLSQDEKLGRCIQMAGCVGEEYYYDGIQAVPEGPVRLKLSVQEKEGAFFYKKDSDWIPVGKSFSVLNLSDDFTYGYTGAFVGICAQDLVDQTRYADFKYFHYKSEQLL